MSQKYINAITLLKDIIFEETHDNAMNVEPEEGEQTGGGQESGGSSIGGGTGNITPGGGDPDPDDNGGDAN